jgi:hypothetical protein
MSRKKVLVKRRRTKRRRRKADEEHGIRQPMGPGTDASGLASLQQRVGNRAVQRLLAQPTAQGTSEPERKAVARAMVEPGEGAQVPSGPVWVEAFPVGASLDDLHVTFGAQVRQFVEALEEAGAAVEVLTTRWSPEAAYLMHWAWRIAKEDYDPRRVPAMEGVDIAWWHGDIHASKEAAQEMVEAYGIDALEAAPSLNSPHIQGNAIDMNISWEGDIPIRDSGGIEHLIASEAADGINQELLAVAKTYGLVPAADFTGNWLHWSTDGR